MNLGEIANWTTRLTEGARIAAETDLNQLERARSALADIVPTYINSKVVKIRSNNADRAQGTAGFRWQPLETLEVVPMDYARLVSSDGFNRLLESGQLEVIL